MRPAMIRAWLQAEWLRQLTSPVWAVLLLVWTLICGLFFAVVLGHLERHQLPPGEGPMSFLFRATPWLLPLVLALFVPQLVGEAIAGRRASGRLDQLRAAGLAPGRLVLASWLASLGVLTLLALPPLALHAILAVQGGCDLGQTLAALIALGTIGATMSALALACSCWLGERTAAGLVALALGLIWWIVDLFGHAFPDQSLWAWWRHSLPLAGFVDRAAGGLLRPGDLLGFALASAAFLYCGRHGLRCLAGRRQAALHAGLSLLALVLVLGLRGPGRPWDLSLGRYHAVAPLTQALIADLAEEAPPHLTLVVSPAMRQNLNDGILIDGIETLCRQLEGAGLRWSTLDPGLDPAGAALLAEQHELGLEDLDQPLLLVQHLGRRALLRRSDCAHFERDGTEERLVALQIEAALIGQLRQLAKRGQRPLAWAGAQLCTTGGERPERSVLAWRQLAQQAGYAIQPIAHWQTLHHDRHAALVVPGPRVDLGPHDEAQLRAFLAAGGRLLLLLDPRFGPTLPRWRALAADWGLHWDRSLLIRPQGAQALPALQVSQITATSGPLARLAASGRELWLPFLQACYPGAASGKVVTTALPIPDDFHRQASDGSSAPMAWPHVAFLQADDQHSDGRIILLAGVDAFCDVELGTAGNSLLAAGLLDALQETPEALPLPPRPVIRARYRLTPLQAQLLAWGIGGGLPLLALALGLGGMWWRRRA